MTFADLALGASVFLDANTFLYHFTADAHFGVACTDLVERVERQELTGFTATHVVSEVAHRLMTIEVSQRFGRPFAGIVGWMRQNPAEVQQLIRFRQALAELPRYRLQVLPVPWPQLDAAAVVSQQTGLLHNDALIVAVMEVNGLTNLASNDGDFDRVPGISRYAPI
jgi:predicted nucleic acid-binding protein